MFGRRRHAAPPAAPSAVAIPATAPLPRLAEEQIFELVHTRIAAAIGEGGEWVVRRRTTDDTDDLFRSVLAHQVALDVTAALRSAQSQLEAGERITVSTATGAMPIVSGSTAPEAVFTDPDGVDADKANADVTDSGERAFALYEPADAGTVQASETHDAPNRALDDDRAPSHRHDEAVGDDDAVLDEEAIALQWEPAPITMWTDLKKPVTGPIALEHVKRDLVA